MPGASMRSRLAVVVLLLGIAFFGYWLLDADGKSMPSIPVMAEAPGTMYQTPNSSCGLAAPTRLSGQIWTREQELVLVTNDVVRLQTCSPGTLSISARGTPLNGLGAHMVVSLGGFILWDDEIEERIDVVLELPTSGWVAIAFVNDRLDPPEDRNLWLETLEFHAPPQDLPGS